MSRGLLRRASTYVAASVAAVALGMVSAPAHAAVTPVLQYSFPASFDGTGTTATDLSGAGNNGTSNGPVTLSSNVPPGATSGTQSITTNAGGFITTNGDLLTNALIATHGGLTFDTDFMWDGTTTRFTVQKLIDYGGNTALQLNLDNTVPSATVQMRFNDAVGPELPIVANHWYHAVGSFDSQGNSPDASDNLDGLASISLDDLSDALPAAQLSLPVTITNAADGTAGNIAIGTLDYTAQALVDLNGQIYNPSVSLGVVPEPATVGLLGIAGLGLLRRRRHA